jgi:predicted ArsR family transcriptional regulator
MCQSLSAINNHNLQKGIRHMAAHLNRERVKELLDAEPRISKAEVARRLGIAWNTARDHMRSILDEAKEKE